ncbi:hypothetical protein [Pseudoalteromonas sp. MMG024]|uniref:pentapeptide repeat-containing protein n=1 Tax=Pseudoalteromonas sp. MMG024 TaxID=2909980 RepID=UPI001F2288F8|nr:hypothetical protein [Pseudoalteromonas sp. MMG024]MCF6456912.1 hypothetical protein [Pseudoalteromonas sp. MMG024]
MTSKDNKKTILKGEEAIALWESGHVKWNEWVEENPEANIDFSKCDFSKYEKVSFSDFVFPKGNVNFNYTKFGNAIVVFCRTKFGYGDVSFHDTDFGEEGVNFSEAIFGNGNVYFDYAHFRNGYVDFSYTKFGKGKVMFNYAVFSFGSVSFHKAQFDEADFTSTQFGFGDVSFLSAVFKGDALFIRTMFGEGGVTFTGVKSKGNMFFNETDFGICKVSFRAAKLAGYLTFQSLKNTEETGGFDFSFSNFEGAIKLKDIKFYCVPDFTNTNLSHQFTLDHFEITPVKKIGSNLLTNLFILFFLLLEGDRRKEIAINKSKKIASKFTWFNIYYIADKDDIPRIRRLKELAESNKHHKLALDLHAEEIKCSRWVETKSKRTIFAEYLFQLCSDFGRSLQRPIVGLISSWLLFTLVYYQASNRDYEWLDKISDSAAFSFAQMLPVFSISREAKKRTLESLFNIDMPNWIIGVAGVQSFISIALVFLVGLALRNRFRI